MHDSNPIVIAIVGAESTGKTTLAEQLAVRIANESGLACTWVDEWLRRWCEDRGRPPQRHEQAAIADEQARRIEAAATTHAVVVCDTTPLMTAVYSRWVFGDHSLDDAAGHWHRRCALTLLTAIDLPWVADGLQREGPHVQAPVDTLLRELLVRHELPFAVIGGQGEVRLERAVDAVAPLLLRRLQGERPRQGGLFTRLAQRNTGLDAQSWRCEFCDDPDCERRAKPGNSNAGGPAAGRSA